MTIRGNITLTDAASTPVNHVYNPTLSTSAVIAWQDNTQVVFVGRNRLTCSQRIASRNAKSTKVAWKLETPVLEQTSPSTTTGIQPAPTVAYTLLFSCDFVLPDRCTLQERKDLLAQARDLINEAIIGSQIESMDFIY